MVKLSGVKAGSGGARQWSGKGIPAEEERLSPVREGGEAGIQEAKRRNPGLPRGVFLHADRVHSSATGTQGRSSQAGVSVRCKHQPAHAGHTTAVEIKMLGAGPEVRAEAGRPKAGALAPAASGLKNEAFEAVA